MTKKQGLALPAGIYKIFWKRGGWSWAAIGCVDEEKQRPCEIHEKLRRFVKDGTSDLDVKWVIDVITEAAAKAVEIG